MGFPWPFSSSGSAHLHLPLPSSSSFFFLSPFCFFSVGGPKVMGSVSLPWPFLCFTAFFSSPLGRSGRLVFLVPFFLVAPSDMDPSASLLRVFWACLSSRTHQVSQATSFQLVLHRTAFHPDTSPHSPAKSCIS